MPNEETTTKIKVDITELKKEMQEAVRSAKLADSEFQKVASTCDDWSKSSDGISAKLKSLNSNLDSQKAKLSLLEAQYDEVVAAQGKGSKAAQELEIKMNKQKAAVNKTQREIDGLEGTLGDVTKAEKIAAKTGKDVSDVLDDMKDSAEEAEGGFSVLKGALAVFAGNVMTSFAGAVKDGIMNLAGLADETREYRTELAKMSTAATQAGADTDFIKSKWQDMSSALGDEGAVGEGLNNLMAAGYNTKAELDGITAHLEGAAIKWKDTLKFEGLADGLQETLATGAAVGSFSEMLERSGVNLDTFNEGLSKCTTEADKQNYVLQELNKLGLSEVSSAYRDQNADLIAANKANSDYTDTMATLGAKIEPVITTVKQGFADILTKILELTSGADFEAFAASIKSGFDYFINTILPKIVDGFQWILDNKDLLIAGLAGIAAGFVAFKVASLINTVVQSFQAFKKAQEGATVAQWLMNAAMNANPIMLIVTVITAVIAAIVAFIATNDDARAKIVEAWNAVKEFVGKAIDSIVKFFTETIPQALSAMVDFFKELPGKIWEWLVNVVTKVAEWYVNMQNKAKETAVNFVNSIITFIKELPGKIWEWLVNVVTKVAQWYVNMQNKAKETALGFVNKIVTFIKELPGKVWNWLKNVVTKVAQWAVNMQNKAKETASNFINKIIDFFKELPGKIWTWLKNVVTKIAQWGVDMAAKGKEAATKLFTTIITKIKELPGKVLEVGKNLVKGIWDGISGAYEWIKKKIKEWVGNVTKFIKKLFGIKSPSRLWRDEVGVWLARGIAEGIEKGKSYVVTTLETMGSELLSIEKLYVEESNRLAEEKAQAEYKQKLAQAKTAEELEKAKQENLQKIAEEAQQKYLDTLKTAGDKERAFFESRKNIAEKFRGEGDLTYSTISYSDGEESHSFAKLADVGADNTRLKEYIRMLDELESKRGALPEEVAGYLSEMGLEEGENYIKALLRASDSEYTKYIDDLAEKTQLAHKISEKVTSVQEQKLAEEIKNLVLEATRHITEETQQECIDAFETVIAEGQEQLPEGFKKLGTESGLSFIGEFAKNVESGMKSLMTSVTDALPTILKNATNALKNNAVELKSNVSQAKFGITKLTPTNNSSNLGSGNIIKNYTQNIITPSAPNRLTLYRNTKNLLALP